MAGTEEGMSNYEPQLFRSSTMSSGALPFDDAMRITKIFGKIGEDSPHRSKTRGVKRVLHAPPAILHYEIDAGKLFGGPPYLFSEVDIRTSDQMERGEDIKLPQFDPNFFSPKHIQCRFPHCPETKARKRVDHDSSQLNKEDLYLCQNHRQEMTNLVTKQCAEIGINVNYKDSKSENVDDYTSLIGYMEKAFLHFKMKASLAFPPSRTDLLLAEIFINVRNFLIITNLLLNPDDDNQDAVVHPIAAILKLVLERCDDEVYVRNVNSLLRELMVTLLLPFNVACSWVSFQLEDRGTRIGAGIGIILGGVGAAVGFGGISGLIALGAGIGFLGGGLLGGGVFDQQRIDQNRYHLGNNGYRFKGETDGRLSMQFDGTPSTPSLENE